ncbi:coat protein [Cotton bunchy top virus 2]|nr:coat protein [Cotton bunchy top virus 2]
MNTAAARNGRRRRRQRATSRQNAPVVVVQTPRQPQRRRRRRRNRARAAGRGSNRGGRRGGNFETFVFSKDSLTGSTSGNLTFGPSLSDCPAFSTGVLQAYKLYKITKLVLEFISEASSTSSGSIAYEIDTECESTSLQSQINKFSITKGGRKTFTAEAIKGVEWIAASKNQFRLLYKGNGSSAIAGSFRFTMQVRMLTPK